MIRRRLTYANVMVTILALLVVGGGGAYAAKKLKLKNNSVTTPKIRDGAVNSAKIADGSVAPADVAASLLGDRSVGRSVAGGSCNPPPLVECRGVDLTLARTSRVLVIADAAMAATVVGGDATGACQISVDGVANVTGSEITMLAGNEQTVSISLVSNPLPAGLHHFGMVCSETDPDVSFSDQHVTAVSLSTD